MPRVIMYYRNVDLGHGTLVRLGEEVRTLVAVAFSTDKTKLIASDIDWIPVLRTGASCTSLVDLDIEAIGYPERKQKLTRKVLQELKQQILKLNLFPQLRTPDDPLIWVKYQDPDGLHI